MTSLNSGGPDRVWKKGVAIGTFSIITKECYDQLMVVTRSTVSIIIEKSCNQHIICDYSETLWFVHLLRNWSNVRYVFWTAFVYSIPIACKQDSFVFCAPSTKFDPNISIQKQTWSKTFDPNFDPKMSIQKFRFKNFVPKILFQQSWSTWHHQWSMHDIIMNSSDLEWHPASPRNLNVIG